LALKHTKINNTNTNPIQYYYCFPEKFTPQNSDSRFPTFTFHTNPYLTHSLKINVKPSLFFEQLLDSSLKTIRKNLLVNLSSGNIPQDIQCLLQLGENFSLPLLNKEKIIIELIKSVECITQKFDIDTQLNLRNRAITTINNLPSISLINNSTNQRLTELMKSCTSFIHNNPNIIVTRADKGNTTVVLNRLKYINRNNVTRH